MDVTTVLTELMGAIESKPMDGIGVRGYKDWCVFFLNSVFSLQGVKMVPKPQSNLLKLLIRAGIVVSSFSSCSSSIFFL